LISQHIGDTRVNNRTLPFSLALALIFFSSCAVAQEAKNHVLIADWTSGGLKYTIDGNAPKDEEGLLLALSRVRSADTDQRSQIIVLVHERAQLADLSNLIGLILKADYASYRVFVFDGNRRRMNELWYSKPVPFSKDGSLYTKAR
jgi:hypothetical protein